MTAGPGGESLLRRFVVVLHQPQELVNVALVVRAMKNMGLSRLRLVDPAEFDPMRIEGIAHDTEDLVAAVQLCSTLEEAVADAVHVVATTARRRAVPLTWLTPAEAAPQLAERAADGAVAIVFGREDRGLSNRELDRCREAICIPTSPAHPSLNLSHAALIVFYELRRAVAEKSGVAERDLTAKPRNVAPPATAAELEAFFHAWEAAMEAVGLFHGVDPEPKMRAFRRLFARAEPDAREIRLLSAAAHEVLHYARRLRRRVESESD